MGYLWAMATEVQVAVPAEVTGLEMQAAVATEVQNEQEQHMGRLQQQQELGHSQQHLSSVAHDTATQFTQLIHNAAAMSAANQTARRSAGRANWWEQQWQSQ